MRGICRTLLFGASLTLLPSLSFAEDPYADYRIPEHYWRSWTANLNAGGNFLRSPAAVTGESRRSDLNARGATRLTGGFDSDPRSTAYGLTIEAFGDRRRDETSDDNFFGGGLDEVVRNSQANERASAFATYSHYPWAAPLGLSLFANVNATFSQAWDALGRTATNPPDMRDETTANATVGGYQVLSFLGAGVSWGRVRDATPVYQVQVLEQRLLEEGTIQRELSRSARERLASLYTTEAELAFAHDRPTKYFWRELERLLAEDGVLGERGLDAYAVQRLLEPLTITGTVVARARGFSIGPQVFLTQQQMHSSFAGSSSTVIFFADTVFNSFVSTTPRTEVNDRSDFILSGVTVDYHRPFGPRWQVDGISRAMVTESGREFLLSSGLSGVWLVADRWYADAKFAHELVALGSGWDRKPESWRLIYGATLSYFLEDNWALQLGATQGQFHFPGGYSRQEQFSLGVSYRFSGFLNAPGLFEPMRLSPPAR